MIWHTPQPAHVIYPFSGGWQVIQYVWRHVFERTDHAAQDWFKWGHNQFAKAGNADNVAFSYWLACLGFGAYLAGAFEYLAAMLIVSIFTVLHFIFLSIWAGLAVLCVGILALFNKLYEIRYRIFSPCPACHHTMPMAVHICPACGREHTLLRPSAYGVFKHRCWCGAKLSTLGLLGRNQYTRKCAHCAYVFNNEIGNSAYAGIVFIGGPQAGKSNLTFMVAHELLNTYAKSKPGYSIKFTDEKDEAEYLNNIQQFNRGRTLSKTTDMKLQAYTLELRKLQAVGQVLYLYDPAGEVYQDYEALSQQAFFNYVSTLVLVLDPFSIHLYRQIHREAIDAAQNRLRPSELTMEAVLSRLIELLEQLRKRPGKPTDIPLAVVISKADALDLDEQIGHAAAQRLMQKNPAIVSEADAIHVLVEAFLERYEQGNSLRELRSHFTRIKFFSCSALGRPPADNDLRPFQSQRVLEPILWALDTAGAVDERQEWRQAADRQHWQQAKTKGNIWAGVKYYVWDSLKPYQPE